jgi:hypothetical protein
VGHGRRCEEGAAIEVGEDVAGACLGTVDGDNAEVLRPGLSDAGDELTVGLLQDEDLTGLGRASDSEPWQAKLLSGRRIVLSSTQQAERGREECFSLN